MKNEGEEGSVVLLGMHNTRISQIEEKQIKILLALET